MPLNETILMRVDDGLKKQLEHLALKSGVSKSAIARNILAIAILPPYRPSQMEEIMAKVKQEQDSLYGRSEKNSKNSKENNGDHPISEQEATEKAQKLKRLIMEPKE
jgi:predicted transcriptional regulator